MNKVKATDFFQAWMETVVDKKNELLPIWTMFKEFTLAIKGTPFSVMNEIAKKLDLLCYSKDYYSIDAILYKPEDLTPDIENGSFWLHDIRVAFEHENNFKSGLYQEVSHLLLTNCDLRVLVTYPYGNIETELKYLHKIISQNRNSKKISEDESFLIILGYQNNFIWTAYVYKENEWVLMENSSFDELEILKKKLSNVKHQKENAVKNQDFELSAYFRDIEKELNHRIQHMPA